MDQSVTDTTSTLNLCIFAGLFMPLLSFAVSLLIREGYSWIVSVTAPFLQLAGAVFSVIAFFLLPEQGNHHIDIHWFQIGEHTVSANLQINGIAGLMFVVVSVISFLVHLYSTGYMAGDMNLKRYFAMLGFFTFSMLGIVCADNLLLVFFFWELVGFSSYLLIGHWMEKPEAGAAAKKAFLMNRVGDIGFLVGIMIVWTNTGSLELSDVLATHSTNAWQTAASLCIFCGVIGKSAQFPLFTWLADAMEGPTPVSALIHAATMVAAGVYLLARVHFLFTPEALNIVAVVGLITALTGAFAALAQFDVKKILAYSTLSQLGLMVTGLGANAEDAAVLHLIAHAGFKACLFLAAGAIIHMLHQAQQESHQHFDVQDIRNLGGLRKKMPVTFITFLVSGSALAGIPLSSGFLTKDAMLEGMWEWASTGASWKWIIVAGAFCVSFLTVVYTFRLIWFVFMGNEKNTSGLNITEPPMVMRVPVIILAASSLWFAVSFNPFEYMGWLFFTFNSGKHFHLGWLINISSAAWVLMAGLISYFTFRSSEARSNLFLRNAFYVDPFYQWLSRHLVNIMSSAVEVIDRKWIDGVLHSVAYIHVTFAHLTGWIDQYVVDGMVHGVAGIARGTGSIARSMQRGNIQLYIFWAVAGLIIFLIWMLF